MYTPEDLVALEQYFSSKKDSLPKETINFKPGEYIFDLRLCIGTAITILKTSPDNKSYGGHWERLYKIKEYLEKSESAEV